MASTDSAPRTSAPFYEPWIQLFSSFAQGTLLRLKSWSPRLVPVFICVGALPFLILCSLIAGWIVWSSVPQGWSIPLYLQYGDGTLPYTDIEIASLSTSQPYEISLQLTVPAIEANYALGNFMTSLRVATYGNETVADIRKPALVIPPASSLLPFSREPRLLQLTVPLASSLITGVSRVRAHIELGRKDGWKTLGRGEGRELSVYAASLHGVVRPQGLRRVVATFPLSLAITAGIAFFIVSVIVLVGFILPSMFQSVPAVGPDTEVKVEKIEMKSPLEGPTTVTPTIVTSMRRRSSRMKEESEEEEGALSPRAYPTPESDARRRLRRSSTHDNE